jgi:hypothetical protein
LPLHPRRSVVGALEFSSINIAPTILPKKIEELIKVQGIGERSFCELRPWIAVTLSACQAMRVPAK